MQISIKHKVTTTKFPRGNIAIYGLSFILQIIDLRKNREISSHNLFIIKE